MSEINRIHVFVCLGMGVSWAIILFAVVAK